MFLRGIIHYKDGFKIEKEEDTNFWVIQVNLTSVMKQEKKKSSDFSKLKPSSSITNQLPSSFYFLFLAFLKPVTGWNSYT